MPVWSNQGHPPGPLNYIQIDDLIAFIRAPSNQTYTIRDPALGEPRSTRSPARSETFNGWVDANYKPAPGATPFPACWSDEFATASAAPSGRPAAASVDPNATVGRRSSRSGHRVRPRPTLTAPADKPFVIEFDNQDAGVPHNVEIKDAAGAVKFKGEIFNGVANAGLPGAGAAAGSYPFVCTVHPTMTGTLTVK